MNRPVTIVVRLLQVLALAGLAGCARPEAPADDSAQTPASTRRQASTPDSARSGTLPRIVFLGDSLTAGLGIAKEEAVPALIQERLRQEGYAYEVINAGNSGDTSDGGL